MLKGLIAASDEEKKKAIKDRIKTYPDFPRQGIMFKDIFPLFHHPSLMEIIVDLFNKRLSSMYPGQHIDMVVGMDSRGFLFGPELSRKIGCSFVPARKKGKLPGKTVEKSYKLEYGEAAMEIQKEYLVPGKVAVIVDDLIATGGTMWAVYELLTQEGVKVLECQCMVELTELKGRERLADKCNIYCLVQFEE